MDSLFIMSPFQAQRGLFFPLIKTNGKVLIWKNM